MNTNVRSHFEHKNDVTIIIKLHRATRLWLVSLYKSLTMIVTSFLCSKCNRTLDFHRISVNLNKLQQAFNQHNNTEMGWQSFTLKRTAIG